MPNINIPIFYPDVSKEMRQAAYRALGKRIIGQGKKVDLFEKKLSTIVQSNNIVALNSGTSSLELAYQLANLHHNDEVISTVFTCTATNIPLVRRGVKIVFADIQQDMHIDWEDVKNKITNKTKAIVTVNLFNRLNKTPKLPIITIGDSAQYLGKTINEDFTAYSFQATKILTTVDGGALVCKNPKDHIKAKLLRWYGIDREMGKENIEVDIEDPGYKYHMNDVTASIGIAALSQLDKKKSKLSKLQNIYIQELKGLPTIQVIGGSPLLIHAINRDMLRKKLALSGIETSLVHKRNDEYTIFGGTKLNLPNMNKLENTYLLLPCRANMRVSEVRFICSIIRKASK